MYCVFVKILAATTHVCTVRVALLVLAVNSSRSQVLRSYTLLLYPPIPMQSCATYVHVRMTPCSPFDLPMYYSVYLCVCVCVCLYTKPSIENLPLIGVMTVSVKTLFVILSTSVDTCIILSDLVE